VRAGEGAVSGQGANAIAIGNLAGQDSQVAGGICLNASGVAVNPVAAGFYVNPVAGRSATGRVDVLYNTTSFEITYLSSSRTVKNTIEDFKEDTSVVYGLSPKTYFYNNEPESDKSLGYIAEEVDELHTRFASHSADGKPIAIDYRAITVFMVEEMKKLRERVAQLESRSSPLDS
jgi:hypothetical protein